MKETVVKSLLAASALHDRKEHGITSLFNALKHGDAQHQRWLFAAIRAYTEGQPMPPVPEDHRAVELLLLRDFFDAHVDFHAKAMNKEPRSVIEAAAQHMVDCKQTILNFRDPAELKRPAPQLVVDNEQIK